MIENTDKSTKNLENDGDLEQDDINRGFGDTKYDRNAKQEVINKRKFNSYMDLYYDESDKDILD